MWTRNTANNNGAWGDGTGNYGNSTPYGNSAPYGNSTPYGNNTPYGNGTPYGSDSFGSYQNFSGNKKKPSGKKWLPVIVIIAGVIILLAIIGATRELTGSDAGRQTESEAAEQTESEAGNAEIEQVFVETESGRNAVRDDRKADLSEVDFNRTCQWSMQYRDYADNVVHTVEYDEFPLGAYEYYRTLPRYGIREWDKYLEDDFNRQLCEGLAVTFKQSSSSDYEAVRNALAFVQDLQYISDGEEVEYAKYPIETLYDKGGDCEDTSLLLCGIIRAMGYDSVLILLPSHCAVGILGDGLEGTYYEVNGRKYYYTETTSRRQIGDIPEQYMGCSAQLIEVK